MVRNGAAITGLRFRNPSSARENGFAEAANCFVTPKEMPSLLFVVARWDSVHGQRRFRALSGGGVAFLANCEQPTEPSARKCPTRQGGKQRAGQDAAEPDRALAAPLTPQLWSLSAQDDGVSVDSRLAAGCPRNPVAST